MQVSGKRERLGSRRLSENQKVWIILFVLAVFILISRFASMGHEMRMHPDEAVFYNGASSVVTGDYQFEQVKDYPNGALVFQMPFHYLGKLITTSLDVVYEPQVWGRIASIIYHMLAALLGGYMMWRYIGKSVTSVAFYAGIMSFSLLQIEQSRYGTGDAISLFVIMMILYAIFLFFEEENDFYLYFASFLVGSLAAIKFTLLIFAAYPLCAAYLHNKHRGERKSLLKPNLLIMLWVAGGLILFSPQWFKDHAFFLKAILSEMNSYVLRGNFGAIATFANNLASSLIYQLLYAEFPLALPIAIYGLVRMIAKGDRKSAKDSFLCFVIPVSIFVFLLSNMVVATFFFRAIYPYYSLCILYTAYGLGELCQRKKLKIIIAVLMAFMVVRGSVFIYALMQPSGSYQMYETLTEHEEWEDRVSTVRYGWRFTATQKAIPDPVTFTSEDVFKESYPKIREGEFVVTQSVDYAMTQTHFFPSGNDAYDKLRTNWEAFKEENQQYYIGQAYPRMTYPLFGAWMLGSTLTEYEFMSNYIYYRPYESQEKRAKAQTYRQMNQITDARDYFQALYEIDECAVIITSISGLSQGPFQELELFGDFYDEYYDHVNCMYVIDSFGYAECMPGVLSPSPTYLVDFLGVDCEVTYIASDVKVLIDDKELLFREKDTCFLVYDYELESVVDSGEIDFLHENEPQIIR